MARQQKEKRNKEVVRLREQEGWTYEAIGKEFNIKKHTAYEVYHREIARRKLSTVGGS
jgi:hypothetical protein